MVEEKLAGSNLRRRCFLCFEAFLFCEAQVVLVHFLKFPLQNVGFGEGWINCRNKKVPGLGKHDIKLGCGSVSTKMQKCQSCQDLAYLEVC